mmetsp:Transcript_49419/g.107710  ORF Transcript_49419/g.107710 Transcript_49419/m.107710 type:complete len:227 (-) Transcript_49419:296-976(-)
MTERCFTTGARHRLSLVRRSGQGLHGALSRSSVCTTTGLGHQGRRIFLCGAGKHRTNANGFQFHRRLRFDWQHQVGHLGQAAIFRNALSVRITAFVAEVSAGLAVLQFLAVALTQFFASTLVLAGLAGSTESFGHAGALVLRRMAYDSDGLASVPQRSCLISAALGCLHDSNAKFLIYCVEVRPEFCRISGISRCIGFLQLGVGLLLRDHRHLASEGRWFLWNEST